MKFGISTFVTDEGIGPADLGRAAEQRGFDSLFLAEHTHIPTSRETPYPGGEPMPRHYYRTLDPFVSLTAAAAVTNDLLLATGIALVVERDPITTAKEVASLDHVSGGRAIFGVGAGWNREEMRNHGTDPTRRGQLMDERIRAMRALWTDEQAEFHGQQVRIESSYCWPKPVQQPHPPIYVGGESERSVQRVAEYGGGWLPRAGTSDLAGKIAEVRQRAGWRVPVSLYASSHESDKLEKSASAGVDRVLFYLPTQPRDESLRLLDQFAESARECRTSS